MDIYVGRQPIFDRKGNIYGYELLYRNSQVNRFPNVNPESATLGVLINTFLSIGVENVSEGHRSFINFTEKLLTNDALKLNPRHVVIEVLENVNITKKIVMRLRQFKEDGFKIALDDFILQSKNENINELFKIVNFIKVDYLNTTERERRQLENVAKEYPNIVLLAEKIESEEQFKEAELLGYKLFQGYFFAKPDIVQSKDIPANYALYFHIINLLNKETPNIREVADLISRDVSLSYKVLRYINSLAFDIPNEIKSIQQALVMMGIEESRKWMQIIMLYSIGTEEGEGRVRALVEQSLTRAKLCELLARHKRKENFAEFFLAGMFSLIDVIMKRHLKDILPQLPLSNNIKQTLVGEETEMQPYLALAKAVEQLELDGIEQYSEALNVNQVDVVTYVQEAYKWVTKFN